MSELNEKPAITQVNTPAPSTIEALLKAFIDQSKETAESNKALAEAILESRKPYMDPRVIADREQRRKDRELLVKQVLDQRRYAKKYCPHTNEGGKPNIKWMQHSNGIILGVCGSCNSQFDATHDRDDAKLLREDLKSIRNMGRAGEHARRGADIAG
jgi:hypothetical protein